MSSNNKTFTAFVCPDKMAAMSGVCPDPGSGILNKIADFINFLQGSNVTASGSGMATGGVCGSVRRRQYGGSEEEKMEHVS